MRDEFSSKIFIGQETKNRALKVLYLILGIIITGCVLIKFVVGDFRFSDISGILFVVFLIGLSKSRMTPELKYGFGVCMIDYEADKMTITYPNIGGNSSEGKFTQRTIIRYADIESIEYGRELECFRIVGKCDTQRQYLTSGKEKNVRLASREEISETFIYVLDEEEQPVVFKNIQKNARFIIRVVEDAV